MTSTKTVAVVIATPTAVPIGTLSNIAWDVRAVGICGLRVTLRHNVIPDHRSFRPAPRAFLAMLAFLSRA